MGLEKNMKIEAKLEKYKEWISKNVPATKGFGK